MTGEHDEDDVLELDTLADDELEDQDTPETDDEKPDEADEPSTDNSVIRRMRAELRAAKREKAELERKMKEANRVDPGPRPTLDDFDFVQEDYDRAVEEWQAKKAAYDTPVEQPVNDIQARYQASHDAFQAARVELTKDDPAAEDALLDVDAALGAERTGAIIHAFKGRAPSLMVAIGANPDLMDKLADMDPFELLAEVATLQTAKGQPVARNRPDIDEPLVGKPAIRRGPDAKLAKLEAEAERTGDRTALIRYRKEQRERGRA